jgi:putative transposase
MGKIHKGTVTSKGIKFKHLIYDNVALEHYRKQYPQTKESRKKIIKIDPDDLSRIFVFLEEMGGYIEVQ